MKLMKNPQKHTLLCAFVLVGLMVVTGCGQSNAKQTTDHWIGTWSSSAQEVEADLMPAEYKQLTDTTVRQVVRVSAGGTKLRVRFSNAFGGRENLNIDQASIAVSTSPNTIDPETIVPLTFSGQTSFAVPGGTLAVSDPVEFDLEPGSDLTVTIHVARAPRTNTGHRSARGEVVFIQSGNAVNEKELPTAVPNKCWYYLCGVEVMAPASAASVVCLGDSITDGKGSTEGENRRWPDYLARRLQANPKTADLGMLNQGIGGNCLWSGGIGQTVLQRLERDVIAQPGAKWVIILEGINDIGGRGNAENIITALKRTIAQCHASGLLVYGSTVLPCGNSFYFNQRAEEQRQLVNEWIRTSGQCDAVIDWDAVVRDPENPANLLAAADSGDHLHLSDEGYRMMVDAVDLSLFEN